MKEGEIILTNLPQADGVIKLRPALVLRQLPGYHDFTVCGISTQLHQCVTGFDELIREESLIANKPDCVRLLLYGWGF